MDIHQCSIDLTLAERGYDGAIAHFASVGAVLSVRFISLGIEAIPYGSMPVGDETVVTTRRTLPDDVHAIIEDYLRSNLSGAGFSTGPPPASNR